METFKTSNGIEYQFVHGLEQAEEITDFRQTSSCFNAHEVNPAIGCDFLCRYCSMYSQYDKEEHVPVKIYSDYPNYLRDYIKKHKNKENLIFNFSPKTDAFSLSMIESGMTENILKIFDEEGVKYYILTKSGLPPKEIQNLLIKSRDKNQIIISSGLPNEEIEAVLEPGAPPSSKRLEFAKFCSQSGIMVTGIVAPYLPIDDDNDYAYKVFNRFLNSGIRHASVQVLKLSVECLNRMCKLLPKYEQRLNQLFDINNAKSIEWKLPGGKTVIRYYVDSSYLEKELKKLKLIAKNMNITVSTCKEVCININDVNYNAEAQQKGYNCVGFTKY
ncbi:MAG: hypothetical protein PWP67_1594 [Clostridium butyricum]|jgi:DNA repair photolyase|nr:hypothetical protein [Clostridium butyricum]